MNLNKESDKVQPKKRPIWSDYQDSDSEGLRAISFLGAKMLRPPKQQSLRIWSDENRVMASNAARPGKWQTGWAPCAPGVYDAYSEPSTKEIIICCSTQLMKSEFLINVILYLIEVEPAPMMLLQPDMKLANKFADKRIGDSAKVMPYHQPYLQPTSSVGKKANGTKLLRPFPGGELAIRSSNEQSSLISDSMKYILCDEVNKFARDISGDLKSRQTMFPDSKTIMVSSVGPVGECRITAEYERGDMNEWHIVCTECGVAQIPDFYRVRWPRGKPQDALYVCEHCQSKLTNGKMKEANRAGFWVAGTEAIDGVRSFKVNSLAHPTLSLADLAREYTAASVYYERNGDDERLRKFWTDRMSVNYENPTGALDHHKLKKAFIMDFPTGDNEIPSDVHLITVAVDVQGDRLEIDVCGWGYRVVADKEGNKYPRPMRYGLHFFKIMGDTGKDTPFLELEKYFDSSRWKRQDGLVMKAFVLGIDSGGNNTDTVIEFTKGKGNKRIFPLKGASTREAALFRLSTTKKIIDQYQNDLVIVGTYQAKDYIFASLKGSSHEDAVDSDWYYPARPDRGYDNVYYAGLTAEKMIMQKQKNKPAARLYVKTGKARNEPLDLAVYNLALLRMVGEDDLPRRKRRHDAIIKSRVAKNG